MAKHERMTITLPAALKSRMLAYEPPINWSAVACRAFEAIVVADKLEGPSSNMTVIPPDANKPEGPGIRLLDREDVDQLRHDLDAGRIVAVFDGATDMVLAYAVCIDAVAIRQVFQDSAYGDYYAYTRAE